MIVQPADRSSIVAASGPPQFVPIAQLEQSQQALAAVESHITQAVDEYKSAYPLSLKFDYSFQANQAPFDIEAIWHDDKFTYIKTDAPEKFSIYEMRDGKPNVVTYQLENGTYVIPKVMDSGYVELGKKRMEFTYGELIDVDRLLRSMTVVIHRDKADHCVLTIGAYEKGQSAAESLSFARYLLFQALCWHRIARSVRAMMKEAIRLIPTPSKGHGKGGTRETKSAFNKALEELLGVASEPKIVTAREVLSLIEKFTSEPGKIIVRNIKARNYYKRLATIYLDSEPDSSGGKQPYLDRFRVACGRPGFNSAVQEKIRGLLEARLTQLEGPTASALAPARRSQALDLLKEPGMVLCDCPKAPYGTNQRLLFIPEPQRLQHNYLTRVKVGERVSEMWEHAFYRLMNIAAKGRIFCDPRIRDTLMAAVGPDSIREGVRALVDGAYSS